MITTLPFSTPRRTTQSLLVVLAVALASSLFVGCSDEIPVMADVPPALGSDATSTMSSKDNGLTIQTFPGGDNPGPPLLASGLTLGKTGFGATRTDGEWVAITFVRDPHDPHPDCLAHGLNLLSPPPQPVADCSLTIKGRVWVRDPSNPMNPVKAEHQGLGAVPVYFVHLSEFEAAVMDGVLTIAELEGLPSLLIGYASFHRDEIRFPQEGRPGKHSIGSRGQLQDGRSFQHSGVVIGTKNVQTRIEFK